MQYTRSLAYYFKEAFEHADGEISEVVILDHEQKNIDAAIKKRKTLHSAPQFIYLAAGPTEASMWIKALRTSGWMQPIVGGDAYVAEDLIQQAGAAANNVYFTAHGFISLSSTDQKMKNFIEAYRAQYGHLPRNPYAALGYDTINLIAYAMREAGTVTAEALLKTLPDVDAFQGVTGRFDYRNGHIPLKSVDVVMIQDSKAQVAARLRPAYVPLAK